MRIAFWSAVHGQPATTANMSAIATIIALEYNASIMMTSTHFDKNGLDTAFIPKEVLEQYSKDFIENGIDGLARYAISNIVDKESLFSHSTTLINDRLNILLGTTKNNRVVYETTLLNSIVPIMNAGSRFSKLFFVDVCSGRGTLSEKILNSVDLVVINVSQNINQIDEIIKENEDILHKAFFVIGRYDEDSRYCIKNICRRYKGKLDKARIGAVPYNINFSDALNDGRTIKFIMDNAKDSSVLNDNYEFIEGLRYTAKLLMELADIGIARRGVQG